MRALLLLGTLLLATAATAQQSRFFSVGSGYIDGGYYETARTICRHVNRGGDDLRCSPEPTSGSLYNIAALRDRQVDFALVQSDWQRAAYEGSDIFADEGPMTEMRSVMSLYPEAVTILARNDAGIESPIDLVDKRIDIGHPTSGRHATLLRLIDSLEMGPSDFAMLTEMTDASAIAELCAGRLDAVALIVGHPNAVVGRALQDCDVSIAPFSGPRVDAVFAESSDFVRIAIPRLAYPGVARDVPTYAVTATLITRADISARLVEAVVARTLESLDAIKSEAPLLARVEPDGMATLGLTAPLHEAARAAFESHAMAGSAAPMQ